MNKTSLLKSKTKKEDDGPKMQDLKGYYTIVSKNVEGQNMDERIITSTMLHEDGSKYMLNVAVVPESHRDKIEHYFVLDDEDLRVVKEYAEKEGVEKAVEVLKDVKKFWKFHPSKKAYIREMNLAPDKLLFFIYEVLDMLPMLSARQGKVINQKELKGYYEKYISQDIASTNGVNAFLDDVGILKDQITIVPDFIACQSRKEAFQSSEILPIYTLSPRAQTVVYSDHCALQIFRKIYCGIPWENEKCQNEQMRKNLSSVQQVMKTLSPKDKEGMYLIEQLDKLITGIEAYDWTIPDLEEPHPDHQFSTLAATDKISIDKFREICEYYGLPAYFSFLWAKDEKKDEIAVWEARVLLTTGWIQKSTFPENMKEMMRYQLYRLQPEAGVKKLVQLFLTQFHHKSDPVKLLDPKGNKAFEERQKRNEILQQRKLAKKGKDVKIFEEGKKVAEENKHKIQQENKLMYVLGSSGRPLYDLFEVEEEYYGKESARERFKKSGKKVLKLAKEMELKVLTSSVAPTSSESQNTEDPISVSSEASTSSEVLAFDENMSFKPMYYEDEADPITYTGDTRYLDLRSSKVLDSKKPHLTSSEGPTSSDIPESTNLFLTSSEIVASSESLESQHLDLTCSEAPPPGSPPLRHSCSTSSETSETLNPEDSTPSTPPSESIISESDCSEIRIPDKVTSSESRKKSRRIDERLVEMGKRLEIMGKELAKERSEKKKMEKEKNQEIKKRDREIEKVKSAKSKLSDASDAMTEELQQYKKAQEKIDKEVLNFAQIEANLKRGHEEKLQLQEKIIMMEREMKMLENNLKKNQNVPEPSDLSRLLNKAKCEISNLKSENEKLKENLVVEDVKCTGLDALLQKERARSAELEEQLDKLEKWEKVEKKSSRKLEKFDDSKMSDEFSKILAESEAKEERLKTVNLRLMERINAQQKEMDSLKKSLEKMEEEIENTPPPVDTSETLEALEKSKSTVSELQKEIGSLKEEIGLLKREAYLFETGAEEMEEQLQREKNKNHKLMEEIDAMRKNSMNVENQKVQNLTSEVEKLQNMVKSREDVIENLKRLNVGEVNKSFRLSQEIENLNKEFRDDKMKNMNDGHNLYKKSREENERLKSEISHLKNIEGSVREYNKRISAESLHQKDQIAQMEKSKIYDDELVGQQRKQISDLTTKMGSLSKDIKILRNNLELLQEEKRKLVIENHDSQEAKKRIAILEEHIEKQKKQENSIMSGLQQKIKNLESQNQYLESSLRNPRQPMFLKSEIQEKLHRLEIQNQQQEATIRMLSQIVAKDSTVLPKDSFAPTTVPAAPAPPTQPPPPQFYPPPRCFFCQGEIQRNQETMDCQNCRKSYHKWCGMRLIADNHPCFCCGKRMEI